MKEVLLKKDSRGEKTKILQEKKAFSYKTIQWTIQLLSVVTHQLTVFNTVSPSDMS